MFNIITHSRFFNLDEVAAIALLDIFLLNGKYNLIRTRDEKILQKHQADINSYVIDVGFKFEKDKQGVLGFQVLGMADTKTLHKVLNGNAIWKRAP